jgi:hypothetical protein
MSALTERARDFWDRISPRERKLVLVAAVAAPVTIVIWLGLAIHDGLDAMEARNNRTWLALQTLADMRARGLDQLPTDDVVATMGTEPLSLDTYLTNAAKKAQFDLKSVITPHSAQSPRQVGSVRIITNTSSLNLDKVPIQQLKDFLQQIETGSKVVAITRLDLNIRSGERDKINVSQLEVSTYSKEPPAKAEGSGSGSDAKKGE